jgi:hypothetical protein
MTCSDNDPGFDVDIFSCATDDDDDEWWWWWSRKIRFGNLDPHRMHPLRVHCYATGLPPRQPRHNLPSGFQLLQKQPQGGTHDAASGLGKRTIFSENQVSSETKKWYNMWWYNMWSKMIHVGNFMAISSLWILLDLI